MGSIGCLGRMRGELKSVRQRGGGRKVRVKIVRPQGWGEGQVCRRL